MDALMQAKRVLEEPTLVVGMGNAWRNDDGVGVHVVTRLAQEEALPAQLATLSVEDVLESYAFDISRSDRKNIVLVDAVSCPSMPAGSVLFGPVDEMESKSCELSTHKLALSTAAQLFAAHGKETFLLGIVAANTDFGSLISPPVLQAADRVVELVRTARSQ